jgi:uncharacterized membrane protein YhiD involved in acid resistance
VFDWHAQLGALRHASWILPTAALLAGTLGFVRPVRRGLMPRPSHVIQTQVLLAVVGAIIILVVAESLARAFAIVGAAGLVRYRAKIDDPKDAGVLLVSLAIGLIMGTQLYVLAIFTTAFVMGVLWLLESLEPVDRAFYELEITSKDAMKMRPRIDHVLRNAGVRYELRGTSPHELRYEVSVPFDKKLGKLTKQIISVDKHEETSAIWNSKKPQVIQT